MEAVTHMGIVTGVSPFGIINLFVIISLFAITRLPVITGQRGIIHPAFIITLVLMCRSITAE